MQELVSVIVPAFNVKDYIEKCINSLIQQTYRDLEIIIIDDGSTDGTGAICDRLAESDQRIKVIHKENGGLSSARNAGIDEATGDYLSFVDSDDWVDNRFIETLVSMIAGEGADISIVNCFLAYENGKVIPMFPKVNKRMTKDEAIHELCAQKLFGCMACQKLYKSSLFDSIRFPIGELYEDVAISLDLFVKAQTVSLCGEPLYYYFQRAGSIVNSAINEKKLQFLKNIDKYIDYSKKNNDKYQEEVEAFYLKSLLLLLLQGYSNDASPKHLLNYLEDKLKEHKSYIKGNSYIETRRKIMLYFISVNAFRNLISKLWKFRMRIKAQ